MRGKVSKIGKSQHAYAIILGHPYSGPLPPGVTLTSDNTYYCNQLGMAQGYYIESLKVGDWVEFTPKLSHNKRNLNADDVMPVSALIAPISEPTLPVDVRKRMIPIIVECLRQEGRVDVSRLNQVLMDNHERYSDHGYEGPAPFLRDNFSDFLDFEEIPSDNNSTYTRVRLRGASKESACEVLEELYNEFDRLIAAKDYDGALRSPLICAMRPADLPIEYMQKALSAAHELLNISDSIRLNRFEKCLVEASRSEDLLIYKWDNSILDAGRQHCYVQADTNRFRNFFNALIGSNTTNEHYLGIARRFQSMCNPLYLPFYVLALYAAKGDKTMRDEVVSSYYEFAIREEKIQHINSMTRLFCDVIYGDKPVPPAFANKVLGVMLDADRFGWFASFYSDIFNKPSALAQLIQGEPKPACDVLDVIQQEKLHNSRVGQKFINFYLSKMRKKMTDEELIHFFARIAFAYPLSYLFNIIYNDAYRAQGFGKEAKCKFLNSHFADIVQLAEEDPTAYPLVCYIQQNRTASNDCHLYAEFTKKWVEYVTDHPDEIARIYPLFKWEAEGRQAVEQTFCAHLQQTFPQNSPMDEVWVRAQQFHKDDCSFATIFLLEHYCCEEHLLANSEMAKLYLDALKASRSFDKAIHFARKYYAEPAQSAIRDEEMLYILYLNFHHYGVDEKYAYRVFNSNFTLDDAEQLALKHIHPDNHGEGVSTRSAMAAPLILMAIYKQRNDVFRVAYLYSIYADADAVKETQMVFLNQLRKWAPELSHIRSHYQTIRLAFTRYSCDELFEFLQWASGITIDEKYRARLDLNHANRYEVYSNLLDAIISTPWEYDRWEDLVNHMDTMDTNAHKAENCSPFNYAARCIFFLKYYYSDFNPEKREIADIMFCQQIIFPSLVKIEEVTNFFSLNAAMVAVAPEAYIMHLAIFYEKNGAVLAKSEHFSDADIEAFYIALLTKYNETHEDTYLRIAVSHYTHFHHRLNPHVDLLASFCSTGSSKTALFKCLFTVYSPEQVPLLHNFIYHSAWNCTTDEAAMLDTLKILYAAEEDPLPAPLNTLSATQLHNFKCDVAAMMQSYPFFPYYSHYPALMAREAPLAYKYLVLQYVMKHAYNQQIYRNINEDYWDALDQKHIWDDLQQADIDGIAAALGFYKTCYVKQCSRMQRMGQEYISRRYHNLYLIDTYFALMEQKPIADVDDRYIQDLMQNNDHTELLSDAYQEFKAQLAQVYESDLSIETKRLFLMTLVRDSVCPLFQNGQVLQEVLDHPTIHTAIKTLFDLLGYPSMAQSALHIYRQGNQTDDVLAFARFALPPLYRALVAYENLSDEPSIKRMQRTFDTIINSSGQKKLFTTLTKLSYTCYENIRSVLVPLIIATIFNYNVVRDLGNMIRNAQKVSNDLPEAFIKDLLSEMGQASVYGYLCAVRAALQGDREAANNNLANVFGKTALPILWHEEYEALTRYIRKETDTFTTANIDNDFTSLQESTIENSTTLRMVAKNLLGDEPVDFTLAEAVAIFLDDGNMPPHRLRAGSFVLLQTCENVGKLSKCVRVAIDNKDEAKEYTFNCFLFEYGLLALQSSHVSNANKADVILELIDFHSTAGTLSSKHRLQFKDALIQAFRSVFLPVNSDAIVPYDRWIRHSSAIKTIVNNLRLLSENDTRIFTEQLDACVSFERQEPTAMERIHFLTRINYNLRTEALTEHLFAAAKAELERLRNGWIATIAVINHDIEDNSIFLVLQNHTDSKKAIPLGKDVAKFFVTITNARTGGAPIVNEVACSEEDVSIRPGQSEGLRIHLGEAITQHWSEGDEVSISIVLVVDGIRMCDNTHCVNDPEEQKQFLRFVYHNTANEGLRAPYTARYDVDNGAWLNGVAGFGRSMEIQWLTQNVPAQALTVLYGPSRVGKSSLLNYIRYYLAPEHKKNTGKAEVYVEFVGTHNDLPDEEEEILQRLFLAPIRKKFHGLLEQSDDNPNNPAAQTAAAVLNVIAGRDSLENKLERISNILGAHQTEIWVLLDEFQDVVAKWSMAASTRFAAFYRALKTSVTNIRYVLCGADELVQVVLYHKLDSVVGSDVIKAIGQFSQQDKEEYFKMLRDTRVWEDIPAPFSDEALEYIFTCTGGNAMLGKLIGSAIITEIENGQFAHRRRIYPYDVSRVLAILFSNSDNDLDHARRVSRFIDTVTKNLSDNEMRYLAYIATLMKREPDRIATTIDEIFDHFHATTQEQRQKIRVALKLCCIRGILRAQSVSTENGSVDTYTFGSQIYFQTCLEKAKHIGIEDKIVDNESDADEAFKNIPSEEQAERLIKLLRIAGRDTTDKVLEEVAHTTVVHQHNTTYNTYNNTVTNNYLTQIINTFNTVLATNTTPEQFLEAFKQLPRLANYLPQEQQSAFDEKVERLEDVRDAYNRCVRRLNAATTDAERERWTEQMAEHEETIAEHEAALEEMSHEAEESLLRDTLGAAIKSDDIFSLDDARWQELLGLDAERVAALKALPSEYATTLTFAVLLHSVFNNLYDRAETHATNLDHEDSDLPEKLDYCPVAILYCKVVETMLRNLHTPLYIERLGDKSLGGNGEPATFSELGSPLTFDPQHHSLTIGTFARHLVYLRKNCICLTPSVRKPADREFEFRHWFYKDGMVDYTANIHSLMNLSVRDPQLEAKWMEHAKALKIVTEIRNHSAHSSSNITKEHFDWLIDVLFHQGELLNIWELAQASPLSCH